MMRREEKDLVVGRGEIEGEQFNGLERRGGGGFDLADDELEAAEGDVGAVDQAVALHGVVWGEIGDFAVVDGRLVRSQVEAVPEIEQLVWSCRHFCFLFGFLDLISLQI